MVMGKLQRERPSICFKPLETWGKNCYLLPAKYHIFLLLKSWDFRNSQLQKSKLANLMMNMRMEKTQVLTFLYLHSPECTCSQAHSHTNHHNKNIKIMTKSLRCTKCFRKREKVAAGQSHCSLSPSLASMENPHSLEPPPPSPPNLPQ